MNTVSYPTLPHPVKRSASARILASEWPKLFEACRATYFPSPSFFVVNADLRSDAGYVLSAAIAAESLWNDRHAHRPVNRAALDAAFAGELNYHWTRGRRFGKPTAALWVAISNLIVERPEKILKHVKP